MKVEYALAFVVGAAATAVVVPVVFGLAIVEGMMEAQVLIVLIVAVTIMVTVGAVCLTVKTCVQAKCESTELVAQLSAREKSPRR